MHFPLHVRLHHESELGSEEIAAEANYLVENTSADDTVWIFVIGHAYHQGGNSYFNIPDRDLSHHAFARLFDGLVANQAVFFICTPASGPYIRALSREGRVIVTATDSGRETNGSIFHTSLANALRDIGSESEFDLDQDGHVSLLDLYLESTRHLADVYLKNDPPLVATEHPLLDDDADGKGSELQIDYLTVEQGGRSDRPLAGGKRKTFKDGAVAAAMLLPLGRTSPADGVEAEVPK